MVLLYLAVHPHSTAREVSDHLGITERQVFRIVRDLEQAMLLNIYRGKGGRNTYGVEMDTTFRQRALSGMRVRQLVKTLAPGLLELTPNNNNQPTTCGPSS
jgi:DNA-binding IclR family transcriptional regulator